MIAPRLVEVLEARAASLIAAGVAAPLSSALRRIVRETEHTAAVRLPSGKEVRLELDDRLSAGKVSELVAAAVSSANSGDEKAVRRAVDASHVASQRTRAAGPG
jgi:hypothetical protein